jgi:hypothetical protein
MVAAALVALGVLSAGGSAVAKGKPSQGPTPINLVAEAGYEVTALFDHGDVFGGWSSWNNSGLTPDSLRLGDDLATDTSGNVFVMFTARDSGATTKVLVDDGSGGTKERTDIQESISGVVRWNAATDTFTEILTTTWTYPDDATPQLWDWDRYGGELIYSISIVPAGATLLPAGHLVLTRWAGTDADAADEPDDVLEVVLFNPATQSEVQVLKSWPADYDPNVNATAHVGPDGTIHVSGWGIYDDEARGAADSLDKEIIRLVPSLASGSYSVTESVLTNSVGFDMRVLTGPDGMVYSVTSYSGTSDGDIYDYDPDAASPSWVLHSSFTQGTTSSVYYGFRGWDFDADGSFWIGLRDRSQARDYVAPLTASSTTSWSDRVAVGMERGIRGLDGDPTGGLIVLHDDHEEANGSHTYVTTTVYRLIASAGGDTGGGGGGGGNGKGKNK